MEKTLSISQLIATITSQIINSYTDGSLKNVHFIGIQTNGVPIAKRMSKAIADLTSINCPVGTLSTTLFRDDLTTKKNMVALNQTSIPFSISGTDIILVDDIIDTGRTIRAALGALQEYGRTRTISCATLIDKANREMPISCPFTGIKFDHPYSSHIKVKLTEIHGEDTVLLES